MSIIIYSSIYLILFGTHVLYSQQPKIIIYKIPLGVAAALSSE